MLMQQETQAQGWHTSEWGAWGWLETILKLVALAAGVIAFFQSNAANPLVIGENPHLAALILLGLETLGAVGQLGIRFIQREIVSFAFAILNLLGHLGLLVALLRVPTDTTLFIIFGVFYALGQVVKVQFLRTSGYTEGGASSRGMVMVSWLMAAFYVAFVVLMLL